MKLIDYELNDTTPIRNMTYLEKNYMLPDISFQLLSPIYWSFYEDGQHVYEVEL